MSRLHATGATARRAAAGTPLPPLDSELDQEPVRDVPTTWTVLQHDGPNHPGLRCSAFP